MDTILSQFHPPPTLTTYHPQIHPNITPTLPSWTSMWTFPKRFPHQNFICISCLPIKATCSAHCNLLNFTRLGDLYKTQSSFLYNIQSPLLTSATVIFLGTLFSNTCRLCSSLNLYCTNLYPQSSGTGMWIL